MKPRILACLMLFSMPALATRDIYDYCIISGVASGAEDEFISNLSAELVNINGITYEDRCSDLRQLGYQRGKRFAEMKMSPSSREDDIRYWTLYQNFRDKVMRRLIDSLNLQ